MVYFSFITMKNPNNFMPKSINIKIDFIKYLRKIKIEILVTPTINKFFLIIYFFGILMFFTNWLILIKINI